MASVSERTVLVTAVLGSLAWTGCGKSGKVEDFTPAADNARKALTAALDHWIAGNKPGSVPGTSPAVEVVDTLWKGGQKLKSYEILSDSAQGSGPRTFNVRLTLDKGPPIETQYMVIGIDPLWVYRKEDFAKLSG
jgi:hypothetical protein